MADVDGSVTQPSPGNAPARKAPTLTKRQRQRIRLQAGRAERTTWEPFWQDVDRFILPGRTRFIYGKDSTRNRGERKDSDIVNNTAGRAVRILGAGMYAGLSSPARPWFRLQTRDPQLNELQSVKVWCSLVEEALRQLFLRGNIYNGLQNLYAELPAFCTAALYVDEDDEDGLRGYHMPIGTFTLGNGPKRKVNVATREFSMTVAQLVEDYGYEKLTRATKAMVDSNQFDKWVDIVHMIEPNADYVEGGFGPRGMKWASTWFEKNAGDDEDNLRDSGYHEFPVLGARWGTTGEDVYGRGPGFDVIGDVKALQVLEKRKAQLVEKLVNPPMVAPTSLERQRSSLLPGDITYVDGLSQNATFKPAHEIHPQAVAVVGLEIGKHEQRINAGMYADLWLMLAQNDSTITAREVVERHEEKMLQLGPVLEKVIDDVLSPLVERGFNVLQRNRRLPPPPDELRGADLRVEFISILAQAQKLMGYSALAQFTGFVSNLATQRGDAWDKVDVDEIVDQAADILGVAPNLVRSDEDAASIRNARAQAQAQQAQAEQAQAMTGAVKNLGSTPTDTPNALTDLLGSLSPLAQKANPAGS
jgi:hypothetical protein